MSTLIDITNKIKNEEKFIKLYDKTYKVDDSKNTVLKVMSILESEGEAVAMDKAIELILGKEAKKYIDSLNLSVQDYQVPFIAVMACVNNVSYEAMEEQFRNDK